MSRGSFRDEFQKGYESAKIRSRWHGLRKGLLMAVWLAVVLSLPVGWYWKIATYLAGVFFAGLIIQGLAMARERRGLASNQSGKLAPEALKGLIEQNPQQIERDAHHLLARPVSRLSQKITLGRSRLQHLRSLASQPLPPEKRRVVENLIRMQKAALALRVRSIGRQQPSKDAPHSRDHWSK